MIVVSDHRKGFSGKEEAFPEPSPVDWRLVATEVEGGVFWEDGCRVLADAFDNLMLLQEIDEDEVEWETLLRGLDRLQILKTMSYPPLRDLSEFEEFEEFLTLTYEDDVYPAVHKVYMAADEPAKTGPLLEEFAELSRRLKEYPPLIPFL